MLNLLQGTTMLGGSLLFYGLLLLPVVFLLGICVVYTIAEMIHNFRRRKGLF